MVKFPTLAGEIAIFLWLFPGKTSPVITRETVFIPQQEQIAAILALLVYFSDIDSMSRLR
jgi:hypothetical protein